MIKAIIEPFGHRIIGLSEMNIDYLKKGDPIRFNLNELKLPPFQLFIVYGKTEDHIQREFQGLFAPQSQIIDKRGYADRIDYRMEQAEELLKQCVGKLPNDLINQATATLSELRRLIAPHKLQGNNC